MVQFAFAIRGLETYPAVLSPRSVVVRRVIGAVLVSGDYFIFVVVNTNGSVCMFRSDIEQDSLVWLKAHLPRLRNSTTTETQYDRAVAVFERRPQPPEKCPPANRPP